MYAFADGEPQQIQTKHVPRLSETEQRKNERNGSHVNNYDGYR